MLLFIILYKMVGMFELVLYILRFTVHMSYSRTLPVVVFIMQQKVVLPMESMEEILKCDHSNESY